MISYINGKLTDILNSKIVVETGGVGFDINFPLSNFVNLPSVGEEVKIFTYMNVKEDDISLYGFLTKEDREMFLKLLTVNGVGPKGAMNIISTLGFSTLIKAISSDDNKLISTVVGIGPKTAKTICLELGDKVRKMKFDEKVDIIKDNNEKNEKINRLKDDLAEALIKLGHKESVARTMIAKLDIKGDENLSELLKNALKT